MQVRTSSCEIFRPNSSRNTDMKSASIGAVVETIDDPSVQPDTNSWFRKRDPTSQGNWEVGEVAQVGAAWIATAQRGNEGRSGSFRLEISLRMKRGLLSLKLGNKLFSAVDHMPIVDRSLKPSVMFNFFVQFYALVTHGGIPEHGAGIC
jgi:hypothetical protein